MPEMPIHEVIIQVGDVDAAVGFYEKACGFRFVRAVEHGDAKVVEMDADGQRITLVPADAPGIRLALPTADARAEQRRLRRADVAMQSERPVDVEGGAWVPFEDPWGNPLGFWQDDSP